MPSEISRIAKELQPYILGWLEKLSGIVKSSGDFYPRGDQWGIMSRFSDCGITPSDHFRNGSIPTGYAWQGAPFATPNVVSWNVRNDYAGAYFTTSGQKGYLAKTYTAGYSSKEFCLRVVPAHQTETGLRLDDGSDNNYVELMFINSGFASYLRTRVRTGGGTVTSTDYAWHYAPVTIYLLLLDLGSGNKRAVFGVRNEAGWGNLGAASADFTWTPSRAGLILTNFSYTLWDWFYIP